MDQVSLVQLNNALTLTVEPFQRRLNEADSEQLSYLLDQMACGYPNQDVSESAEMYRWGFEQLALRYSLLQVTEALASLRIKPRKSFFPTPEETAEEIESLINARRHAIRMKRQAERRETEITEFWEWAPTWIERTGNSEEELLKRFPSFKGTKPR
jgi:hypothetical protein